MKQPKNKEMQNLDSKQSNSLVDLLKGRFPDSRDKVKYFVTLFAFILFWGFVVWRISLLGLSIPFLSNIRGLFSKQLPP